MANEFVIKNGYISQGDSIVNGSLTATTLTLTPLIYGSTAANGDIIIDGTSHATKTTSYVNIQNGGGRVNIGPNDANSSTSFFNLTNNITGGVAQNGYVMGSVIQSDVTLISRSFISYPSTIASAFTLANLYHFQALPSTFGTGSTVTNQYGFFADSAMIGATNNYGFYGGIASGTNRWNTYMAGTAQNYFAGNVGIGVATPVEKLSITETVSTTTAQISAGQAAGSSKSYFGNFNDALWLSAGGTYRGSWVGDNANRTIPYFSIYAGNADSYFAFATTPTNNSQAIERMRITSGGSVGIGTATPGSLFEIKGADVVQTINMSSGSVGRTDYANNGTAKILTGVLGVNNWGGLPTGTAINDGFTRFDGARYTFAAVATRHVLTLLSGGNVGIGTATPGYPLDVQSTVTSMAVNIGSATQSQYSNLILTSNGGSGNIWRAGSAYVGYGGANSLNIYNSTVNPITFYQATNERMRIHSNGYVGIGTLAPATLLEVTGNTSNSSIKTGSIEIQGYAVNNTWIADNTYFDGAAQRARVAGFTNMIQFNAGNTYFKSSASQSAGASFTPSTNMFIGVTGNVGIGTIIPTAKVQVTTSSASTSSVGLFLVNSATSIGTEIRLAFAANSNTDIASNRYSYISAVNTSGSNGQDLKFATNETGADATEKMRITSGGSVGIGTSVPVNKLDVLGSALLGMGTEQVTAWSNLDFAVFTSSGSDITSMSGTANGQNCYSPVVITLGKRYVLTFTASQAVAGLYFSIAQNTSVSGVRTNLYTSVAAGINTIEFISTDDYTYAGFTCTIPFTNTTITDFTLKEVGALQVTNTGLVGIGTTTPVTLLEVIGSTSNSSIKAGSFEIQGYSVNNSWIAHNTYYDGTNYRYRSNGLANKIAFQGGNIHFQTVISGSTGGVVSLENRMFIENSTGNVGIGTITPITTLDVNGGTIIRGGLTATTLSATTAIINNNYTSGALIVGANSNKGDFIQFTDTFDGTTFNTSNWTATGVVTQNNNLSITGASTWTTFGITSTQAYDRSNTLTLMMDVKHPSLGYAMYGWASGTTMAYTNMPHAIYFMVDGNIAIYENGSSIGNVSTYTAGVTYRLKIVTKQNYGAKYYISSNSGNTWTTIYDGSAAVTVTQSPLYVRATVYSPTGVIIDDVSVSNGFDVLNPSQFFSKNLTIGESLLTPKIYGGDAANGDITIEGTSSTTKTTSYVNLQPTGGNVGIGMTTPVALLELPYNTTNSGIKLGGFEIQGYTVNDNWLGSNIYYNLGWKYRATGFAAAMEMASGDFYFHTAPSGSAGAATLAARMVIKNTGNVGIGTAAPSRVLTIQNGSGTSTNNRLFYLRENSGDHGYSFNIDDVSTGKLFIKGVATGVESTIATIDRGTNSVGIGTTEPISLLTLSQTAVGNPIHTFLDDRNLTSGTGAGTWFSNTIPLGTIEAYTTDASGGGAGGPGGLAKIEFTTAAFNSSSPTGEISFSTRNATSASYVEAMRIDRLGRVGIGASPQVYSNVYIGKVASGSSAYWHNVFSDVVIQGDVTGSFRNFSSFPHTQASAFTLTTLSHFEAYQGTFGAGSTVTNQYGFNSESSIVGAGTINAGFRGNIAAAANRWNNYMVGTAQNYFAGNVGIGIAAPTSKLDVRLSGNGTTGDYFLVGGSQTYKMLGISEDSGTNGLIFDNSYVGANYMAFRTHNGTSLAERMRIHTNGYVGIGTTTPITLLDVNGGTIIRGGLTATTISATTSLLVPQIYGSSVANGDINIDGTSNATKVTSSVIIQQTGGNTAIGMSPVSYAPLAIGGDTYWSGSSSGIRFCALDVNGSGTGSWIFQAGQGSAALGGGIAMYSHSHATKPGWMTANISSGAGAGVTEGRFTVNNSGVGGGTDVFTVLRTGNVGIGTTAPFFKLDVLQTSASTSVASIKRGTQGSEVALPITYGIPYLEIGGAEYRASSIQSIGFGYTSAGSYQAAEIGFLTTSVSGYTQGDIVFANRNNVSNVVPVEAMRITSAGNVGINVAAPAAKLHLTATTEQLRLGYDTSNYFSTTVGSTGRVTFNSVGSAGSGFTFNSNALINSISVGLGGNNKTYNTVVGFDALSANTTGNYSVAIGWQSMLKNTTGYDNCAVGYRSLEQNTTGVGNTGVGGIAGLNNTIGDYNTSIGRTAGINNITGSSNINIGAFAGYYETGSNQFYLYNTTTNADTLALGRTRSLMWGTMDTSTSLSGQQLTINGALTVNGTIKITGGTPGSGKVLTSDSAGLASWATPSGSIQNVKVSFTPTEIKALGTTPKLLVAAPAAGKLNKILNVSANLTYVAPVYGTTQYLWIQYSGGNSSFLGCEILDASVDSHREFVPLMTSGAAAKALMTADAITLGTSGVNPTLGGSDISIYISYIEITM